MTVDEAKEAIDELKAQGANEEEIAGSFYLMFVDGKIDVNQLNALVNLLGYHLTEEFLAMGEAEQKEKGFEKTEEPAEGVSEDTVEKAKDDETNPVTKSEEEPEGESEENSDEEEDEEKKAMKLFGK